ncbi:MAG: hypothetical protein ABIJ59_20410 [Pseudomonadota bacterium]|uniref:Uncharacterized protein n=1 Tax=viral metagenome TaxID=1070528 RepID=A0A6H2A5A7_9ZZZZ
MAYFPNGTAGEYLDEQCAECIHEDPEAGCPIALVQMEFNYSQHNKGNGELKRAMDILINKHGDCQMKKMIDKYYKKLPVESAMEERPKYKPSKLWGDA